ncbi:MAG: DNA internalization-related competence protein ComEC/Rec2 [Candidatus Marinimicrobia bacterium]|nr:DNA internalization-related competence protein ComEC/Rec2 [Candidatus Neomarinimicrobiota bacterium]
MQFIKNRPAIKLLPFLIIGILIADYFPYLGIPILICFICSIFTIWSKYTFIAIPICLITIGFFNHSIFQSTLEPPSHLLNQSNSFVFKVQSIKQKSKSVEYILDPINYHFGNTIFRVKDSLDISPDDILSINGKLVKPHGNRNPGAFNYKKYLLRKGIKSVLLNGRIDSVISQPYSLNKFYFSIRKNINQKINKTVDKPYNSLIMGFLLGEKGELDYELLERFRQLGIIHVLAVSGLHVGFIFMILNLISQLFRLNPFNKFILIAIGLLIYMGITGYPASVIRAGTLGILYSYAQYRQKIPDIWNILSWTAFLMLILNSNSLFNVGFQLSFGAVSGIIFVMNQFNELKENINLNYKSTMVRFSMLFFEGMVASSGALLGTFIPVAYHFHEMSLIGIFFNIIIIPLTFLMVIFGIITIIISFINISFASIYGECVYVIGLILNKISIFGDSLNIQMLSLGGLSTLLIFALFIGLLLLFYFKNSRYWQSLIIYSLIFTNLLIWRDNFNQDKITITFLDVGQGDACIIHSNNGVILIDAGYVGFGKDYGRTVILPHLKYLGIEEIDLAIFSHPHADHIGGFEYLANHIKIKEIWDTKNKFHTKLYKRILNKHIKNGSEILYPNPGEKYKIGEIYLTALYPDSSKAMNAPNINEASIAIRMDHGENSILFLGDAEHEAEDIISQLLNAINCDIVKIAHHGSKTSSSIEIVNNSKASFGIISVGENNKFKHPSKEIVNRWLEHKVDIFRTDEHGAITIISDGYGMNFYTEVRK